MYYFIMITIRNFLVGTGMLKPRVTTTIQNALVLGQKQREIVVPPSASSDWHIMEWSFGSDSTSIRYTETQFGYYIQPVKQHVNYQFEDFFGFGCGNLGYNKHRTIFIPRY
jgi:hypothetical protein